MQTKKFELTKYERDKSLLIEQIEQQHRISAASSNIRESGAFIAVSEENQ